MEVRAKRVPGLLFDLSGWPDGSSLILVDCHEYLPHKKYCLVETKHSPTNVVIIE